jgi:RHS repeat-associated protein
VSCGPTAPDGSTWSQAFTYDPFGNISKSGNSSFSPLYTGVGTTPTNQFYQIPGGPTGTSHYYDLNGNLTSDRINTYAWDAEGKAVTVNGIGLTYDALGRMVEQNRAGTYHQILYSPVGKVALMNKLVALNVFLPLPGGEQATYTNSTIRFRHYDWLGSARLESNLAENEYGDLAYAPFGESYAMLNTPYPSFTGQQQDTSTGQTGVYDFLYREYSAGEGRWISPDPAGVGAVDPSNPQSWNRYAYVMNNPLALVDPLGLWPKLGCVPSSDGFMCNTTPDNDGLGLGTIGNVFALLDFAVSGSYQVPAPGAQCFDGGCTAWTTVDPNIGALDLLGLTSGGGATAANNGQPQNPQKPGTCSDAQANAISHAQHTFIDTSVKAWGRGTWTPILLGCRLGWAGCVAGAETSMAAQPLIVSGAMIWGSVDAYKEAFTDPTGARAKCP